MIIYGTRGLKSKGESGNFYCPQCHASIEYDSVKVRRWFTLYFIPLIPLNVAGEYLECRRCLGTFDVAAASRGPDYYEAEGRSVEAEFQKAIKSTMILMMLADGRIDPGELETLRNVYGKLSGEEYSSELVREDVARLEATPPDIVEHLRSVGGRLNDRGKAMVFSAAILIAQADGEVGREEEVLLKSIYKALGLSKSQAKNIRAST